MTTSINNRHGSAVVTLPSDTEILITRQFDAPAALVFKAITTPELVKRWWGFDTSVWKVCDIDLRVGGSWRYVVGEGDEEVGFHGVYREIDAPHRIVSTEAFEGLVAMGITDDPDSVASVNTVTLDEVDGVTTMSTLVQHVTKDHRDGHVNSGMEGGMQVSFDRLEDLVTDARPDPTSDASDRALARKRSAAACVAGTQDSVVGDGAALADDLGRRVRDALERVEVLDRGRLDRLRRPRRRRSFGDLDDDLGARLVARGIGDQHGDRVRADGQIANGQHRPGADRTAAADAPRVAPSPRSSCSCPPPASGSLTTACSSTTSPTSYSRWRPSAAASRSFGVTATRGG